MSGNNIIKIYANYGVLGREKVAILTFNRAETQAWDVYEVELPEGWEVERVRTEDEEFIEYIISPNEELYEFQRLMEYGRLSKNRDKIFLEKLDSFGVHHLKARKIG